MAALRFRLFQHPVRSPFFKNAVSKLTARSRRRNASAAVLAVILSLLWCFTSGCREKGKPLNALLITVDTLRADRLGCYGSKNVETPNMDALAASGVLFENAITPVPLTLPSHASILTGRYPAEHGLRDNGFYRLPEGYPNMASLLASGGYRTAAFVSSHTLNHAFGLDFGFQTYNDLSSGDTASVYGDRAERPANETTDRAVEWLKSLKEGDNGEGAPFFMWVHYFDPHAPHEPPISYSVKYAGRPYDGEVAFTDSQVGRLLDFIKKTGVYDQTLVILTADHGEGLGEHGEKSHGMFLYGATQKVPLIITGPKVPEGKQIDRLVSTVDIASTVLASLGVKTEIDAGHGERRNLWPLITGADDLRRPPNNERHIYLETESPANLMGWTPLKGIRSARYKFIRGDIEELYDLERDPGELNNIASSRPAIAARLKKELNRFDAIFARENDKKAVEYSPDAAMRRNLKSLGYIGEKTRRRSNPLSREQKIMILNLYDMVETGRLRNDCEKTVELGAQALQIDPDNPRIMEMTASCLHSMGKAEEAAALYEKLLAIDPRLIIPWTDLASVYINLEKYEKGRNCIIKALQIDPNFHYAYAILGLLEGKDGNIEKAVENYRKALSLNPNNSLALYKLGKIMLKNQEDAAEAREMISKAIEIESKRRAVKY